MPKWLLYVLAYLFFAGAFFALVGALYNVQQSAGFILLTIVCVVLMVVSIGIAQNRKPVRN